jgi:hypothetical protein
MTRRRVVIAAFVLAVGGISTGFAIAAGGDDEKPLPGSVVANAKAAALEATGGGTVLETEAGDEGAAYSVEVRLADGSSVEVALDRNFHVIGQEMDDDGGADEGAAGDD